jgi:hypothetical protein
VREEPDIPLRRVVLDDYQGVATEVADWSPVADDVEVASPSADRQPPDRRNPADLGEPDHRGAEVSALNGAPLSSTSLLPHSSLAAVTLSPFAV